MLALLAVALVGAGLGTEAASASTLRLTTNVSGAGTVTADWGNFSCTTGSGGGSCFHTFVNDAPWATTVGALLTATAPTGWQFAGWSGCDRIESGKCWAESDCCYTSTNQTVNASFVRQSFNLALGFVGGGSATATFAPAAASCSANCTRSFPYETRVTITVTPNPGSKFSNWSAGCAVVNGNQCTVDMTSGKSINAFVYPNPVNDNFLSPRVIGAATYSETNTNGGATGEPGEPNHAGVAGELESMWYRYTAPAGGRLKVTACGSHYTGAFAIYTGSALTGLTPVATHSNAFGAGSPIVCNAGAFREIVVTRGTQYSIVFDGFAAADGDFFLATEFTSQPLSVATAGSGAGTVASSPAGIACGSACNEGFAPGATVTLTATPADGSRFAGWAGACGGAAPVCSVTMDGAKTVTATFTDAVAPNTRITAKPKKTTTARKATFRFAATEQPATFQCKLDKGAWKACTSPRTYAKLELGKHTFRVRAKDASGNVDASPAVFAWTIRR